MDKNTETATANDQQDEGPVRSSRKVGSFFLTKGIPLPPTKPRGSIYPFEEMEVGESFLIPVEDAKKKNVSSNLAAQIQRWKTNNPQHKHRRYFTSATVAGGVRCWRIEDEEVKPEQGPK